MVERKDTTGADKHRDIGPGYGSQPTPASDARRLLPADAVLASAGPNCFGEVVVPCSGDSSRHLAQVALRPFPGDRALEHLHVEGWRIRVLFGAQRAKAWATGLAGGKDQH